MPGYMSEYSWVSPAIADFRFKLVSPMGRPVAGSPTCSRYSKCPCAWPVSPSAVERNTADTALKPSTSALAAKDKYRRFACGSTANASLRFFSVLLPFKFTDHSFRLKIRNQLVHAYATLDLRPARSQI